ncbi:MAG TPA: HipA family kinase, partial [Bacilli bacterium]
MALKAVQFVKALATGSTKPFIVEGEDGELYVVKGGVKFVDTTVQVCEWLAYRLGCLLQLPIAPGIIIEIPEQLIDRVPEMQANRIVGGLYYGSRYLYPTLKISLNEKFISQCKNRAEGAAMILFDHWICNFDRTSNFENLIITKNGDLHFHMIDHNGAFYGGWWFDEVYPISPQTFWGKIYQSFVPYIDKTDPFAEIIQH